MKRKRMFLSILMSLFFILSTGFTIVEPAKIHDIPERVVGDEKSGVDTRLSDELKQINDKLQVNKQYATEDEVIAASISHIIQSVDNKIKSENDKDYINTTEFDESKFYENSELENITPINKDNPLYNWSSGVDLKSMQLLYDLNDNPKGYLLELTDLEGIKNGFIIVSANKNEYPILAYSNVGSHIFTEHSAYIEKVIGTNDYNLYMIDPVTFMVKDNDENVYNISRGSIDKIDISTINDIKENTIVQDNKLNKVENQKAWASMTSNQSSKPLEEGMVKTKGHVSGTYPITNPSLYESGNSGSEADFCSYMGTEYYTTSNFQNPANDHCAVTALTNLMAYYKRREPILCQNFAPVETGVSAYRNVFYEIWNASGYIGNGPVWNPAVASSVRGWLNKKLGNDNGTTVTTGAVGFNTYKTEINNGRPVMILFILGKYTTYYDYHWFLGLGYTRFLQGSTWHNYVRIADGWHGNPNYYAYVGVNNDNVGSDNIRVSMSRWFKKGSTWYFAVSRTSYAYNWLTISNIWYYFNPSTGAMYANQWLKWTDGWWYYLKSSGAMAKSETLSISGKRYDFNSSGQCTTPNGY